MSRDYKSSRRTTPAKKKRRHVTRKPRRRSDKRTAGWVWLLCGLGIGLGIAVATYFVLQTQPSMASADKPATKKSVKDKPALKKKRVAKVEEEKPQYDFYTLLPKMEVVIPDSVIENANRALPHSETNLAYVLQTGSFRNASDADTMKAQLALVGIEADVESVVINDKDTWHRVRLGPFPSMKALKPVRRQLKQNDIDFILLKMKI